MSDDAYFDQAADDAIGTRLESVEEIRKAAKAERTPTVKEVAPDIGTFPYRPSSRPPMAMLCIVDDGSNEGEWIRIRKDRTTIGRVDADIVIAHDAMMSARHAEITRSFDKGRCRWRLNDLQSTNGTFVRVAESILKPGQELLVGSRRYRFDLAGGLEQQGAREATPEATRDWQQLPTAAVHPSLVEVTPQGDNRRYFLEKEENWIGRDARRCSVVIADDDFVSQRHLRVYRDAKGQWHIENAKALNGTWLRVNRIAIESTGHFQLGEQRFIVRLP